MVWDKETTEQLVNDGNARKTKHGNVAKLLRVNGENDIISIDTPSKIFYAGQNYETYDTHENVSWIHKVGNYNISIDKRGKVVRVKDATLQ